MKQATTLLAGALTLAASPAAAESWNAFSRSPTAAYLADVDSIVVGGDGVTSIRMALVPLRGEGGDLSHNVDTYEFRCDANQWRSPLSTEFGPDGAEAGQYPDQGEFERARDGTVPAYLKEIACDGARAKPPVWPSIKAFIDAGRPGSA